MDNKQTEWEEFTRIFMVNCHRAGWFGVWDALKSAITSKDRYVVEKPARFSMWMKKTDNGYLYSSGCLEIVYEQTN